MVVGPDDFWRRVHHAPEFFQALYVDHLDFGYEVLEDDPATGVRRTYITPKVDAPAAIKRVLGDSISFTENGVLKNDADGPRYDFHVVPNKLADKFHISGTLTTPLAGDVCERVCSFDIKCTIFGIGKLLEGFVQKEVERSYNDSAEFTNRYLGQAV